MHIRIAYRPLLCPAVRDESYIATEISPVSGAKDRGALKHVYFCPSLSTGSWTPSRFSKKCWIVFREVRPCGTPMMLSTYLRGLMVSPIRPWAFHLAKFCVLSLDPVKKACSFIRQKVFASWTEHVPPIATPCL